MAIFTAPFGMCRKPGEDGTTTLVTRVQDRAFSDAKGHDEVEFDHRDRTWVLKLEGRGFTSGCFDLTP